MPLNPPKIENAPCLPGLECLDSSGVQRLAGEMGRLKAEKAQFASRLNEFVTGTQALEKEWATVNTEALYVVYAMRETDVSHLGQRMIPVSCTKKEVFGHHLDLIERF